MKGRVAIQAVMSSSVDITKYILQYMSIFLAYLQTIFSPNTMRQTPSNGGDSVVSGHERHMYHLLDPLSLQNILLWLFVFDALFQC